MINTLSANEVKTKIEYLYLLYLLPESNLGVFKKSILQKFKEPIQLEEGKKKPFTDRILYDACLRIVAFHQAKREPDIELIKTLLKDAQNADENEKSLRSFQGQMDLITALPGRAKIENRLHRNKGCRYCAFPCRYGFFSLVSDPDFSKMQGFLSAEAKKPAVSQTPLLPVYLFTIDHLNSITGSWDAAFEREHVTNLAFCLLMLGLAKSRLAFPDSEIHLFQTANQQFNNQAKTHKLD